MNITQMLKTSQRFMKRSTLGFLAVAVLGAGTAQAVTTTNQTYNLGISPADTTIMPGVSGLLPWIAKGTLPAGSILRSVSVNAKIETATTDDWASDICVYIDPSPEAPGTAALLQVGGYGKIGTVSLALTDVTGGGWANGQGGPPATVIDTKTDAGWAAVGAVDLRNVELSVGNDYNEASWSGTITVVYDVPEPVLPAVILTFGPGAVVGALVANAATIAWMVPYGTDVTTLAPTFTLSSGNCDKDNGGPTTYNFTNPVVYTVTDGATVNTYTVTVTVAPDETTVLWNVGNGTWDTVNANWIGQTFGLTMPFFNGLNVIFGNAAGGTIAIVSGMEPLTTTVSAASGTYTFDGQPVAAGSLTKSGGGTLQLNVTPANFSSIAVNAGTLYLRAADHYRVEGVPFHVGTSNVTVESGATLMGERGDMAGKLIMNGGTWLENNGFGGSWTGPVVLNATSFITSNYGQKINGDVSGAGGFSKNGGGTLTLAGANTYDGPTTVNAGSLIVKSSLYGNDELKWTPDNITVANTASLVLSVGGAGEFTGAQAGTLFASLSMVDNNGLQAGSTIGYNTDNAADTVTVSATLADSTGTGGGKVGLRRVGKGTLELTGVNTYSGQTVIESFWSQNGTLKVSSFNSVVTPASSSSLGRPTTVADGTIRIGKETYSGATLVYTGTGETTDRVIDWVNYGNLTFDQSGTGLLKFISPFVLAGGNNATITLQGSTVGSGELGGAIGTDVNVTKAGAGTWTLSGVNAYTGVTTVNEGTLLINGNNNGTGEVRVKSGARLGGSGKIGGNVNYESGAMAVFTPGQTLTVDGTLTTVTGNIVHLTLPPFLAGGTYTLATYNTTGSSGTFATVPVADNGPLSSKATITTENGTVKLYVPPKGMVITLH